MQQNKQCGHRNALITVLKRMVFHHEIKQNCRLGYQAMIQGFSGKSLYHGLIAKAAILFYLMVKNHPFQNGNKRIAMTTLFVLLHKNKKWLKVDNQELYNFAIWIAASPARLKDETVKAVEKFIKTY